MVDAGEDPDHTAQREFLEETMNSAKKNAEELAKLTQLTADVFSQGKRVNIYRTSAVIISLHVLLIY